MTTYTELKALGSGLWALSLIFILSTFAPLPAAAQTDYQVGPHDVVAITVFGEPDLSGKFAIEQDGTFAFPFIGRVKAGNLTLRALEQEIKKQLADGYLKNPQVTAAIETYRSQSILVMGEVRAPGEYQLTGDTSLLAALARAGSTLNTASREAVIVRSKRMDPGMSSTGGDVGESQVIKVDLARLQAGDLTMNVTLQDGDTVNIPKAQSVFVTGQVKSPGAYAVDPDTTVLQALSLAGGLTERGTDNRLKILRTIKGKKTEVKAKLSDTVQPGDTIIVPERFF